MGHTLIALGAAFLAAGWLARLGRRFGLPTIPLFMIAGITFGPHTPGIALVEDPAEFEVLAALGLVLLLFHLGLEFSLRDLLGGGRRLLAVGAAYVALNVGGGIGLGLALGWGNSEALVIAGIVGISSSAIVTKLLVELGRLARPETRLILGVIVVEDVFLALYLSMLQPVLGANVPAGETAASIASAFAFLLVVTAIARWGGRLVGEIIGSDDDELLTVLFIGLALVLAGTAEEIGISDAIGAFMAGLVLAETRNADRVRRLVLPLRDAFAAFFFFAFGLTIEPADVAAVAVPIAVAVALTLVMNSAAALVATKIYRLGARETVNVALTTLARGEFSLILGSMAAAAALDQRIGPFVAGYVLVLALGAPVLAAHSDRVGDIVTMWRRRPQL